MLEFYIKNCSLCTVCLVLLRLKLNHFNRSCFLLFRLKMNHFNRICFLLLHLIAISLDLCFCLLLCLVNVSLKRKLIFFKYLNCLGPRVVIILFEIRIEKHESKWKKILTCQTICQKSARVEARQPCVAMYVFLPPKSSSSTVILKNEVTI